MKTEFTQEDIEDIMKAVEKERRTGEQTRADIIQTLDVIGEFVEDRYIKKVDLEEIQIMLHVIEDRLEWVSRKRRLEEIEKGEKL